MRRIHPIGCTVYPLSCPRAISAFLIRQARTVHYARQPEPEFRPFGLNDYLFSTYYGNASMAEQALGEAGLFGFEDAHLCTNGGLKSAQLAFGKGHEE